MSFDNGIVEKWVIAEKYDYVVEPLKDNISATVYTCDDNVVLAYRGTNEDSEWVDNFLFYGLSSYHSEEEYTKLIARDVATKYAGRKIYITGHSLGGYLTQIGTAEMLLKTSVIPEKVVYFDGIGMNFYDHSGLLRLLTLRFSDVLNVIGHIYHLDDTIALKNYSDNGKNDKLKLYYAEGDPVSAIGSHYGKKIKISTLPRWREYVRNKYHEGSDLLGEGLTMFLSVALGKDLYSYYEMLNCTDTWEYFVLTHSMPSLFYGIKQGEHRNGYIIINNPHMNELTHK